MAEAKNEDDLEKQKLELEKTRLNLERERLAMATEKAAHPPSFLQRNIGTVLTFAISLLTVTISGTQIWIATLTNEKELALAEKQRLRDIENAWQRDFFNFVKDNDAVLFGPPSEARLTKRRMVVATFPPHVIKRLARSLEETALSAEELAILQQAAPAVEPTPTDIADADEVGEDGGEVDGLVLVEDVPDEMDPSSDIVPASVPDQVAESRQEPQSLRTIALMAKPTVFLHYAQKSQQALVQLLANRLLSEGFDVRDSQQIDIAASGTVRHFKPEGAETARALAHFVNQFLAEQESDAGVLRVVDMSSKYNLRRGVFEIWLPSADSSRQGAGLQLRAK